MTGYAHGPRYGVASQLVQQLLQQALVAQAAPQCSALTQAQQVQALCLFGEGEGSLDKQTLRRAGGQGKMHARELPAITDVLPPTRSQHSSEMDCWQGASCSRICVSSMVWDCSSQSSLLLMPSCSMCAPMHATSSSRKQARACQLWNAIVSDQ